MRSGGPSALLLALAACAPHAGGRRALDPGGASLDALALALHEAVAASAGGELWVGGGEGGGPSSERWCRPAAGQEGCELDDPRPGLAQRALSVERTAGAVTRLSYEAAEVAPSGAWAAALRLELGVGLAGAIEVELLRLSGSGVTDRILLGRELRFPVAASELRVGPADPARGAQAELGLLVGSPVGFGAWTAERLRAVDAETRRALDAGEVLRCAHGRYWAISRPDAIPCR